MSGPGPQDPNASRRILSRAGGTGLELVADDRLITFPGTREAGASIPFAGPTSIPWRPPDALGDISGAAAGATVTVDEDGDDYPGQLRAHAPGLYAVTLDFRLHTSANTGAGYVQANLGYIDPAPDGDAPNGLIDYSWWSNNTTGFAFPDSDGDERYLHCVLSWPLMRLRDGGVFTPQLTLRQGDAGDGIELEQSSSILVRRLTT